MGVFCARGNRGGGEKVGYFAMGRLVVLVSVERGRLKDGEGSTMRGGGVLRKGGVLRSADLG